MIKTKYGLWDFSEYIKTFICFKSLYIQEFVRAVTDFHADQAWCVCADEPNLEFKMIFFILSNLLQNQHYQKFSFNDINKYGLWDFSDYIKTFICF